MSYDLIMQQALKFHNEDKLDEAERLYRKILETSPHHPVILNLLGLIAQNKGLHSEAADCFSRAIAQSPQTAEYYFNLAWSLERCHKTAEAVEYYHRALQLQPGIKEAHNALGNLYLAAGRREQAQDQFNQAALLEPGYVEPRANLAKMNQDLPALQKLQSQYPHEALIPYYISLLQRQSGQTASALESAQLAYNLQQDEETALLVGELYLEQQQPDRAEPYFRRVLLFNPKSVGALINLANREPDPETAEKMYKQALDLSPQNIDAHINYADLLYRQKRLHEALEEYRQAVILDPEKPEVSNNLGIIQKDFGEYEEALGLFFNALLHQPDRKEYALNIAETLMLLYEKAPEEAQKIARNWLKKTPNNIFARRLNEIFDHTDGESGKEYVQKLFDLFADNYEEVMQRLDYRLPQIIADKLGPLEGHIIDLGCGTGLTGVALKNPRNSLTGIDISPAMLEKARQKKIYDRLEEADITDYCRRLPAADMVVAADVFGYLGALDEIIPLIFPRNFCFSIAADDTTESWRLMPNGRFRHNPAYVKKLLQKAGYSNITELPAVLRHENGEDVNGFVFIAKEK